MKELWVLLGFLFMSLGIIGVILPILPTTPFLLVSAYAFTKGSNKLSAWFHRQPFFQKHIKSMTMTRKKKWTLNIFVDGLLLVYFFVFEQLWIRILLVLLIVVKHYVFYRYVKVKEDE